MNKRSFNFTKKDIDALPIPVKGFVSYSDTKENGLKLYVSYSGSKTFFIRKFIDGRQERIIIGSYPDLLISQAREKALKLKTDIALGKNPMEEKRKLRQDMTLSDFFNYYMERYSKQKKRPKSISSEMGLFNHYVNERLGRKKMTTVSKNDIESLLRSIISAGMIATANRTLSLLSGMYNRAIEWGYPNENPTKGIKKIKEKPRERFIQPDEFQRFFDTLNEVGEYNPIFRDYILISLYTGQRRSNVLAMCWRDISFELKMWYIPMTKNGESLNCVLDDVVIDILKNIKQNSCSKWVFPSKTSASGHYEDPKTTWHTFLKKAEIEDLRLHDLRRTLGSYQAINGSSLQIIGKSLGHKSIQSTQIYARLINAPVRQSTNMAITKILEYAKR